MAPLLNQSTIYRRHHARLVRTYALKDDPRPAMIRVLSGLPLCRLIVPPYQPVIGSTTAPAELAASQIQHFADSTFYSSEGDESAVDSVTASVAPVVTFAAALSGGAAEYVFGWKAASLPQSWLSSQMRTTPAAKTTFHANHDILTMHQQQTAPTGNSRSSFGLPLRQRRPVSTSQIVAASGLSALLFGTKAFMAEKLSGDYSSVASSAVAGALVATAATPLEAVRSYMALQRASFVVSATTTFSRAAESLVRSQGLSSLFKGAGVVYGREIAGATLYFGGYEVVKTALHNSGPNSTREVDSITVGVAGATAGMLYRGFAHGVDTLFSSHPLGMNMTRGVASTLLRAAPANAVLFLGYEAALEYMR